MSGKCIRWREQAHRAVPCTLSLQFTQVYPKNREKLVRSSSLGLPRWKSGAKMQGSERDVRTLSVSRGPWALLLSSSSRFFHALLPLWSWGDPNWREIGLRESWRESTDTAVRYGTASWDKCCLGSLVNSDSQPKIKKLGLGKRCLGDILDCVYELGGGRKPLKAWEALIAWMMIYSCFIPWFINCSLSQRQDTNTEFNKETQFSFLSQKHIDRKVIPQQTAAPDTEIWGCRAWPALPGHISSHLISIMQPFSSGCSLPKYTAWHQNVPFLLPCLWQAPQNTPESPKGKDQGSWQGSHQSLTPIPAGTDPSGLLILPWAPGAHLWVFHWSQLSVTSTNP